MNAPLVIAGCLALLGAGIHGIAGDLLVVRHLRSADLPSTRFGGGPRLTLAMIKASWHVATVAFLLIGGALISAGTALDGKASQALALVGAAGATGALFVIALFGARAVPLRVALRHPAPALASVTAALAWWGAL